MNRKYSYKRLDELFTLQPGMSMDEIEVYNDYLNCVKNKCILYSRQCSKEHRKQILECCINKNNSKEHCKEVDNYWQK